MSDIVLSAGMRQNLLALQDTAQLMQTTQERLATGKKVNSALDNPVSYFTSQSLDTRASQLSSLLDAMGTGIQTIQAANNGITAITSMVQQLESTVSQARADNTSSLNAGSAQTVSSINANASSMVFGLANGTNVTVDTKQTTQQVSLTVLSNTSNVTAGSFTIKASNVDSGNAITVDITANTNASAIATAINNAIASADSTNAPYLVASASGGKVVLNNFANDTISVSSSNTAAQTDLGITSSGVSSSSSSSQVSLTVQLLSDAIQNNTQLTGQVLSTYNTTGTLSLQSDTSGAVTVTGLTASGQVTGGTGTANTTTLAAGSLSAIRTNLLNQFNSLVEQINKTAADSSYNGVNLLNGDTLTLQFNENNTSSISIHTQDNNGNTIAITAGNIGINTTNGGLATTTQFASNTKLDSLNTTLSSAVTELQTQASTLSSSLSIVQTRQSFTSNMINTLQTGADNLVLADPNLEGANMLALQTRQSLSTTALSLSAQSSNAVLQLFQ